MKTWFLSLGLLLVGCSTNQPSASTPAPSNPVTGLVPGKIQALIVIGDVRVYDARNNFQNLQKSQIIQEGSTIATGPNSGTTLAFSNGATVRLKENSQLKVDKFIQAPFDEATEGTFIRRARDPSRSEVELDIKTGSVAGEVKKLNKAQGSFFRVKSPTQGTSNVDGVFSVTAPPAAAPQVSNTNGAIQPGGNSTTASVPTQATQAQIIELFDIINTDRANSGLPPIPPVVSITVQGLQAQANLSYQYINAARVKQGLPPLATPIVNVSAF